MKKLMFAAMFAAAFGLRRGSQSRTEQNGHCKLHAGQ